MGARAAFVLGASAVLTQLTLMREMLAAFSGNEMVLGILLGNWLLLNGLGALAARRAGAPERPLALLAPGLVWLALVPLVELGLLRTLRDQVFLRGAAIGPGETILASLVLLAPYCLISGFLLTLACSAGSSGQVGRVYSADSAGSVAGGLLFTFLLVRWLPPFGILYLQCGLCLLMAAWMARRARRRFLTYLASGLILAVAGLAWRCDLDGLTARVQYAGQHLVATAESPYGRLALTELGGEYTAMEDGIPLFSSHDLERVEEAVHYAMVQRRGARRVLVLGGGPSGTAQEVLKYGPSEVRCVELDPVLTGFARRYFPERLADPRIRISHADGRRFLREARERYDAVLVGFPEPSTCQLNRFYTREFFQDVKGVLNGGGVLSFSMGTYENHLDPQMAAMLAILHRTLSRAFEHVLILPGGRVQFLASDGPLDGDIGPRLKAAGVQTRLLDESWLREMLKADRMAAVQRAACVEAPENRDFSPVLYFRFLRYWASRFPARLGLPAGLAALALGLYLFRAGVVPFALFGAGFAASALEMVLLLGFQVLYGSAYQELGLIVTLFMAGLASGSWAMNRAPQGPGTRRLAAAAFGIAAYAALLPLGLHALARLGAWPLAGRGAFAILAFALAFLVGLQFPLAARLDSRSPLAAASRLFMADYAGACLGALLVSALLIPLLGVPGVCLLAGGLNLLAGALVWARGSH